MARLWLLKFSLVMTSLWTMLFSRCMALFRFVHFFALWISSYYCFYPLGWITQPLRYYSRTKFALYNAMFMYMAHSSEMLFSRTAVRFTAMLYLLLLTHSSSMR